MKKKPEKMTVQEKLLATFKKYNITIFTLVFVAIGLFTLKFVFAAATINIDYNVTEKTLHPLAFGLDESAYGRNAQSLTYDALMRQKINDLDVATMRMYLVYNTPGNPSSGIVCGAAGCGREVSGDAWVNAIKATGAEPIVSIANSGLHSASTDAADAANMVRHFNVTTNNKVKRWIIGNEPDNGGNEDNLDATTYSNRFNQIYDAMKAVDPTIEIGGPATAYFNEPFLQTFLNISGSRTDFVDYHAYGMGGSTVKSEATLLSETNQYESNYTTLRAMIQNTVPSRSDQIEIQVGEWNMSWSGSTQFYTNFNTVWSASALGHIINSGSLSLPYASKNGDLGALWEYQSANSPTGWAINDTMPLYHGIGMFTGESLFRHFGTKLVQSSSNNSSVEVYASDEPKNIVVINKSPTTAHETTFDITGLTSGTVEVWQKSNSGTPKSAPVKLASITITNGSFNYTLPPYSVTTFLVNPPDTNPSPPEPAFDDTDINQDGITNLLDFSMLSSKFGQTNYTGREDINKDGTVNILDFSILASRWTG